MKIKDINEICNRIMSFYDYSLRCSNILSINLDEKVTNEYTENLFKIKDEIDEYLIKKLNKNYTKYPDIFNYCIVYEEDLINNDLLLELLEKYKLDNYLIVLMMNRKLNEEIILNVLKNINPNFYAGEKPYDYRYHILKREEVSDDIKNDILATYDRDELEEAYLKIRLDLEDEFYINKINNTEQLKSNEEVNRVYIAYSTIKKYLEQKVYKK